MSWSLLQSAANSSNTDLVVGPLTPTAGSFIVAWAKWEGASGGSGLTSVTDGTNNFTLRPLRNNGTDMHAQMAYLSNPNGSANQNYTFTINGTESFVDCMIAEFSYSSGSVSFDQQAGAGGNTNTSTTAVSSGNITLAGSGTGLVLGFGAIYESGFSFSNRNINNVAATGTVNGRTYSSLWYSSINSGTLDADFNTSYNAATLWIAEVASFFHSAGGGGGGTTVRDRGMPRGLARGMGRGMCRSPEFVMDRGLWTPKRTIFIPSRRAA